MKKKTTLILLCMLVAAGSGLADSMKNFHWADKNRNGRVTHEEFINLRATWAQLKGKAHDREQSEKIFLNKDRNKDKELTPEEFMKR